MLKRHSRRSDNRGPGSRRIYRSQLPQKLTPLGKRKLIFSCVNPCYFGFFVPRYRNYILTNILLKCVTGTAHHDWSESMIGTVNGVTGLLFFLQFLSLMLTTGLLFFSNLAPHLSGGPTMKERSSNIRAAPHADLEIWVKLP